MNWQPIKTAPKDSTEILTCHNGEGMSVRYWGEGDDGDMAWQPRIRGVFPTHWMPLPAWCPLEDAEPKDDKNE
jgi:hypothetical protein